MVQRLESLRVTAEMDAAKFTAGAQAVADANKKIVDSAKGVEQQTTQTERKIGDTATAYDRLVRRLDPVAKAEYEIERATSVVNRALERGRITAEQHADAIQKIKDRYAPLSPEIDKAGKSAKLTSTEFAILQAGVVNTAQSLAAGMSPWTTFQTQLFQTAPALPALARSMGGFALAAGATAVAVAAVAVPLGIVAARALDLQSQARETGIALRAMGRDAETTAADVKKLIDQQYAAGVSRDEARAGIMAAARNPRVSAADLSRSAALAPDYAAGFGLSAQDATKQLADMAAQGLPGIERLQAATHALTAEQMAQVRAMARMGDQAGAVQLAYTVLENRTKGMAKEALSPMDEAIKGLTRSWDGFVEKLATGAVGRVTVEIIGGVARAIEDPGVMVRPYANAVSPVAKLYSDYIGKPFQNYIADPAIRAAQMLGGYRTAANPFKPDVATPGFTVGGNVAPPLAGTPSGPAAPPPPALAPRPAVDTASIEYVDKATEAYQRQQRVLTSAIGVRDQVRARLEAEVEASLNVRDAAEHERLVTLRVNEAKLQQRAAFNDNLAALEADAKGQMMLADAYGESLAAGTAMEARVRAQSEAFRNSEVDVDRLTAAYRENAAAAGLVQARRSVSDMQFQAAASERLLIASRNGTAASAEAARVNEVETFKRQALSTATDKTRAAVLKEIEAYDAATKARAAFADQMDRESRLRSAANDNAAARADLNAATTIGAGRRAAELEVEALRKRQELEARYGTMADPNAKAEYDKFLDTQKLQEQARQARQTYDFVAQSGERAFDRVGDAMTQMAVEGGNAFGSLRSVAAGVVASIYADFLKLAIANPLKNMVFGGSSPTLSSASGLFGSLISGAFDLFGGGGAPYGNFGLSAGGPRAEGGPVEPGKVYLVGEKGPEPFVPSTPGTILPTSSLNGGVNVTVIDQRSAGAPPVDVRYTTPNDVVVIVRDQIARSLPQTIDATKSSVINDLVRGGTPLSKAVQAA